MRISKIIIATFSLVAAIAAAPASGSNVPPCAADTNQDGSTGVDDIFHFLSQWFSGDFRADFNCNGEIAVNDIFVMLSSWFAGCPTFAGDPNPNDVYQSIIGMPGCTLSTIGMSAHTESLASGLHLFSGEFVHQEVDMRIPGRGFDFVMARTYRSQQGHRFGEVGHKWDYSYNIYIYQRGADLVLHDGSLAREDVYTLQPDGSWTNPEFFRRILFDPNGGYSVVLANGMRWITNVSPVMIDGRSIWRIAQIVDRNSNTMSFTYSVGGRLVQVTDTLGNNLTFDWDVIPKYLMISVTDHTGRVVRYDYYNGMEPGGSFGDLRSVTSPAVTGTPNGNDFPNGKTTTYTYVSGDNGPDYASFMLEITDARGQTFLRNSYNLTSVTDPQFGRLTRQAWGDAGDVIDRVEVAVTPSAGNNFATRKIIVNDRVGNVKECLYDAANRGVIYSELTGRADPDQPTTETVNRPGAPLRVGDPAQFETRWTHTPSGLVSRVDFPNGNSTINTYDTANANPLARGNLLQRERTPGPLGGDQASIIESWQYLAGFGGCGCGGPQFATQYTDPRGNITSHTYDARGNRTRTNHPIASIVEDWEYNAFGQVTAHILPDNGSGHRRRDVFTYYSSGPQNGRMQSRIVDSGAGGLALTTGYEYNARGHVVRVTDTDGDDTQYARNQLDQVVRRSSAAVSTPSGPQRYDTDYTYDAANNLIGMSEENTDANGVLQTNAAFSTAYEYDVLNRLVRTTREVTDADDTVEEYTYDANGNRTLTRLGEAVNGTDIRNTVAWSYDERDRVLDVTQAPSAPATLRNVTRYQYDGNGNAERIRRGTNGLERLTVYTYDGYGRRVTTTDPMGNVVTTQYDANSNITSERSDGELTDVPGSAANVRMSETAYVYDAMNRRTRRDTAFFDPATQAPLADGFRTTHWTYAGTSALLTETDDNGRTSTRTYDRANRLSVFTDAAGNSRTTQWNSDGTVAGTTFADIPDLAGPVQMHVRSYTYDALNRLVAETDSAGSVNQHRYDSRGNRTIQIDGRGNRREFGYDGLSRVVRTGIDMNIDGDTLDPVDIVTMQAWDDNSRLTAQTDDNGNTTRHAYDALNRRILTRYADGTLRQVGQGALWPLANPAPNLLGFTNGHDIHGNIITTRDANGTVVTHQYDVNNRLTRRDVAVGAGVSNQTTFETYSYDGRGRVLAATDDDSSVTLSYDSLSNVRQENQNGLVVTRTFDAERNELTLLYPGGRLLSKLYDELNRTDAIFDGLAPALVDFHYVGPSRIQAMDFGGVTRQSFTYDGLTGVPNPPGDFGSLRVVGSTVAPIGGGPAIESMAYTYDRAGNTTSRTIAGTATDDDYQFDAANRLTRTDRAGVPLLTTYTIDGANNRTNVGGGLDSGAYVLSNTFPLPADAQVNQYTSTPFDARTYDANGNLMTMTPTVPAGPAKALMYDYRNRLVQYSDPATATSATYKYDVIGRRVEASVAIAGPAATTRYIFSGSEEIEERDATGTVVRATVVRTPWGAAVQAVRSNVAHFLISDVMSSPVVLIESTGSVIERYAYTEYGAATVRDSANQPIAVSLVGNPYRWLGGVLAAESGLLLKKAAFYEVRSAQPVNGNFGWAGSERVADLLLPDQSVLRPITQAEQLRDWLDEMHEPMIDQPLGLEIMYEQIRDMHNQMLVENVYGSWIIKVGKVLWDAGIGAALGMGAEFLGESSAGLAYGLEDTDGDKVENRFDLDDDGDGILDEDEEDSDGDGTIDDLDGAPDDPKEDITPESEGGVYMLVGRGGPTRWDDDDGDGVPNGTDNDDPQQSSDAIMNTVINLLKSPRDDGGYGTKVMQSILGSTLVSPRDAASGWPNFVPVNRGLVNPFSVQWTAPVYVGRPY